MFEVESNYNSTFHQRVQFTDLIDVKFNDVTRSFFSKFEILYGRGTILSIFPVSSGQNCFLSDFSESLLTEARIKKRF